MSSARPGSCSKMLCCARYATSSGAPATPSGWRGTDRDWSQPLACSPSAASPGRAADPVAAGSCFAGFCFSASRSAFCVCPGPGQAWPTFFAQALAAAAVLLDWSPSQHDTDSAYSTKAGSVTAPAAASRCTLELMYRCRKVRRGMATSRQYAELCRPTSIGTVRWPYRSAQRCRERQHESAGHSVSWPASTTRTGSGRTSAGRFRLPCTRGLHAVQRRTRACCIWRAALPAQWAQPSVGHHLAGSRAGLLSSSHSEIAQSQTPVRCAVIALGACSLAAARPASPCALQA